MNELLLHIQYLLRVQDCVIVPGLGAFVVIHHKAYTSEDGKVIYPEGREVVFNPSLVHNDGLIVNSIARRLRIDYARAALKLEEFTEELKHKLNADGAVNIGSVGTLEQTPEGKLNFVPVYSCRRRNEELGFYPVVIKRESGKITDTAKLQHQIKDNRHYYIAINKRVAHVAAMICVLFTVMFSLIVSSQRVAKTDMASLLPVELVSAVSDVLPQNKPDEAELPVKRNESVNPTKSEQGASDTIVSKENGRYYLIVATFKNAEQSRKFVEQNEGNGYSLGIVDSATVSRVYSDNADDKDSLLAQMHHAGFAEKFPQAWIWRRP